MTVSKSKESGAAPVYKDRLIGVGQMGGKVASMILQRGELPARGVALDIDASHLEDLQQEGLMKILCDGEGNMREVGDQEGDTFSGTSENHSCPEALGGHSDWAMLVAGLGDDCSDPILRQTVSTVKKQGSLALVICSLPFDMEGEEKKELAEKTLEDLLQMADAVIALPNQSYLKNRNQPVKMKEAFEMSRLALSKATEGVWEMLHADGLTKIKLSHLRELFRGQHVEGLFASSEAEGEDRAKEAVEDLLRHPQMEAGQALRLADACLLQVTGDESLTFKEVDRIKRHVRRFLPEDKSLVVGTSVGGTRAGVLSIRLISAHVSHTLPPLKQSDQKAEQVKIAPDYFPVPIEKVSQPAPLDLQEPAQQEEVVIQNSGKELPIDTPHPMAPPPSAKRRKGVGKKYFQTFLNLSGQKKGRFAKCEPTYYNSINLDEPTFQRKKVLFN
jgi:cell division protein FtsZ